MSDVPPVLRRIDWSELCPWLMIFRTFRLAISLPILVLATAGILLTPLGWAIGSALFGPAAADDPVSQAAGETQWPQLVPSRFESSEILEVRGEWNSARLQESLTAVPAVYWRFVGPFAQLAGGDWSLSRAAYLLFGGIWQIGIWAFLGGAICRLAAVHLGREERISLRQAISHAGKNYGWYFTAPFFPLLGVVLIGLPIALLGLLMRTSVGALLAGVLWPLVLIGGFVMAVMLLGLLCGWPLMWPTISCEEGSDAFEAFSRSYSYTYQRPLQYFFLAALSVLIGAAGWLFVSVFCTGLLQLTEFAAAWGAGTERISAILTGQHEGVLWFATRLIRLAVGGVHTVANAFTHSFFFCAATAVYLLLRRAVDQTDFDEMLLEDEETRYGLPDLGTPTEAGASSGGQTSGAD